MHSDLYVPCRTATVSLAAEAAAALQRRAAAAELGAQPQPAQARTPPPQGPLRIAIDSFRIVGP